MFPIRRRERKSTMPNFEKKLKLLFDAQDFFRDPQLDELLRGEEIRPPVVPLGDDELEGLFAAGDPFAAGKKRDGRADDQR